MDAANAVELLKRVGFGELAGFDGCLCANCSIQGVTIDLACRKSTGAADLGDHRGHCLRVYSRHCDATQEALQSVADVVVSQIRAMDDRTSIHVRLCARDYDYPPRCVYCDKPRADRGGYYCSDACATNAAM